MQDDGFVFNGFHAAIFYVYCLWFVVYGWLQLQIVPCPLQVAFCRLLSIRNRIEAQAIAYCAK